MSALERRRRLGRSGLEVAPLALGTMQFGWLVSDVEAFALLDAYREAGGNFLDTADMYGPNQNWRSFERSRPHLGLSEDVIGRWMQDRKARDEVVLTTKVRAQMWDGADGEGLSRAHVVRAVEDSLRRLRTDRIDLYLAHWPDAATPLEETFATFAELVSAGKLRHVGTSNYAALGVLADAIEAGAAAGAHVACEQLRANLTNRDELDGATQAMLAANDVAATCYSPLASGFLAGRYRREGPVPDSARARYVGQYLNEDGWHLLEALDSVAAAHDASAAEVSLAWLLAQDGVAAAVVGANSPGQLAGWLGAARLSLAPEELASLSALGWAASAPEYTSW